MHITLHVWRQAGPQEPGKMVTYDAPNISEHMAFLEMLDVVNERMVEKGEDPIVFDSDCREGICGACGLVINGLPHGPDQTTTCQLHMRRFKDGDEIWIEPWRAEGFPIIRDLMVDRTAFDRIIEAGGFIGVNTGGVPDANATPIPKKDVDLAIDAAECIGCGACVAACPNASAMLFTSAKLTQFALLPQGQPERWDRAKNMLTQMEAEGFGGCTNHRECEAACPKGISIGSIAQLNRDFLRASVQREEDELKFHQDD